MPRPPYCIFDTKSPNAQGTNPLVQIPRYLASLIPGIGVRLNFIFDKIPQGLTECHALRRIKRILYVLGAQSPSITHETKNGSP
jgi:hypothetical protein|tara:strand:- start:166 stop:417 length:252 start_codon:yes stop_codon:yes gene_type:complete